MEQVLTNSFIIKRQDFSNSVSHLSRNAIKKLLGDSTLLTVSFLADAICIVLMVILFIETPESNVSIALLILGMVLTIAGYSYLRNKKIDKKIEAFGFKESSQKVLLKPNEITINYIDLGESLTISKDEINYIKKAPKRYVILAGNRLIIIPLNSFLSEEDQKFFQRHYFVHYR